MAVVINEFEVVADTRPAQQKGGSDAASQPTPPVAIAPSAIAPALRALQVQALRAWAH
jgi:hypothetical protein